MPVQQINAQDESHLNLISVLHFVMGGLYLLGIGFVILHFMIMSMVFSMVDAESHKTPGPPSTLITESPSSAAPGEELILPEIPPAPMAPAPPKSPPFPKEIIPIMIGFYVVIGLFLVTLCVCNVLSGLFIRKRRNRMFSFVIAGVNCIQFPLGTALGVFTFIVLSRESVKMHYDANTPV